MCGEFVLILANGGANFRRMFGGKGFSSIWERAKRINCNDFFSV